MSKETKAKTGLLMYPRKEPSDVTLYGRCVGSEASCHVICI